jgi:hypothetical protein
MNFCRPGHIFPSLSPDMPASSGFAYGKGQFLSSAVAIEIPL